MLKETLKFLGADDILCDVYAFLLESGPLSAGELAKKIHSPRASVYGYLKKLENFGIVAETQKMGKKLFLVEPADKINQIFKRKKEELQIAKKHFADVLPELKLIQAKKYSSPKLQLFEGRDSVKNILKDMLMYYDQEVYSFWPIRTMIKVLSKEFFVYLNKERIRNNLSMKAIWPQAQAVDGKKFGFLGVGEKFKREIRLAPKNIDCEMGYTVYGSKVSFISSSREEFGFIMESSDFAKTLKTQFEFIWSQSKVLRYNSPENEKFIQEMNVLL